MKLAAQFHAKKTTSDSTTAKTMALSQLNLLGLPGVKNF